jgi:hypothetical protein
MSESLLVFSAELIDEKEGSMLILFAQRDIVSSTSLHNNRYAILALHTRLGQNWLAVFTWVCPLFISTALQMNASVSPVNGALLLSCCCPLISTFSMFFRGTRIG